MNIFIGIMIPFIGTTAGAACVYFLRQGMRQVVQKGLLGFASGVMIAASVWSLLIPAMDMSEEWGSWRLFRLRWVSAWESDFCWHWTG